MVGVKKKFPLSRFKDFLKSVWKTFNKIFLCATFSDLSVSDFFMVRGRTLLEHFSYCG